MRVERRFSKGAEVRASLTDGSIAAPKIEGYGAVFNQDYVLYEDSAYRVVETIAPGAFSLVMRDDVRCLFNHEPDNVLGRSESGTLTMREDANGLFYENLMDKETRIGKDVYQFVKRGDVTGCSFAFIVGESAWTEEEVNGRTEIKRTIVKLSNLYDVGPVTYPAYEQTTVDARDLKELRAVASWAMGMPVELIERINAGKPSPGTALVMSEEYKAALIRQTEINTTL